MKVAHAGVEAAVSAAAPQVTGATGSYIAGGAAAHESRGDCRRWAAGLIRERIPAGVVAGSAGAMLGPARRAG